jgi:hypothetical protein
MKALSVGFARAREVQCDAVHDTAIAIAHPGLRDLPECDSIFAVAMSLIRLNGSSERAVVRRRSGSLGSADCNCETNRPSAGSKRSCVRTGQHPLQPTRSGRWTLFTISCSTDAMTGRPITTFQTGRAGRSGEAEQGAEKCQFARLAFRDDRCCGCRRVLR